MPGTRRDWENRAELGKTAIDGYRLRGELTDWKQLLAWEPNYSGASYFGLFPAGRNTAGLHLSCPSVHKGWTKDGREQELLPSLAFMLPPHSSCENRVQVRNCLRCSKGLSSCGEQEFSLSPVFSRPGLERIHIYSMAIYERTMSISCFSSKIKIQHSARF